MKRIIGLCALALAIIVPQSVFAHEDATFRIGDHTYSFVVGSLYEPIVVDDKTGLDLAVTKEVNGGQVPVAGLEDTLRVELVAGPVKKTITLEPQYGHLGAYKAMFIPTRATTFSYHVTGTLEGQEVDLTFTCKPEGQDATSDDTERTIAPGVTQLSRSGYFNCPLEKETLGFPDSAPSLGSIMGKIAFGVSREVTALVLAGVALAVAIIALRRKR